MKREITITVPRYLAEHFLRLAEHWSDRLHCAGCNDFPVDNTPENLELSDQIVADHEGVSLQEWRDAEEYYGPNEHAGKIYLTDFSVLAKFVERVEAAIETQADT